jgi:outer membrane protein TolC
MELSDIQEKISLQVEQSKFKVAEAQKRVVTARKNLSSADENLRCANVGFKEGVMTVTDVMAAQTAWQKAQTQKLDAEIDLRLAKLSLQKALGNI